MNCIEEDKMGEMFPLLAVALLIWAGVFGFIFVVDRKVKALEERVNAELVRRGEEAIR